MEYKRKCCPQHPPVLRCFLLFLPLFFVAYINHSYRQVSIANIATCTANKSITFRLSLAIFRDQFLSISLLFKCIDSDRPLEFRELIVDSMCLLRCRYQRTTRLTDGGGVCAEKIKQTHLLHRTFFLGIFVVGVFVMKQRARLIVLWFTVQ